MTDITPEQFIDAWYEWDSRPLSDEAGLVFEDLCQAYAAELGIPATELRIVMSGLRASGMTREEAYYGIQEAFTTTNTL